MAARVTPRDCELALTRSQKVAVVIPIVMFVVIPIVLYVVFSTIPAKALRDAPPFFPWFPFVLFPFFAIFFAYRIAQLPHRISATLNQQLVFKSLLKSQSVRIVDILSIQPGRLGLQAGISGYELKHRDGTIKFTGQFTGFYLLLYEMKQLNPSLVITGF